MNDLSDRVLDAHGGLDSWKSVTRLTTELELGGPFWQMRGWQDVYRDQTVSVNVICHRPARGGWVRRC
jgi:hypothetical protein